MGKQKTKFINLEILPLFCGGLGLINSYGYLKKAGKLRIPQFIQ